MRSPALLAFSVAICFSILVSAHAQEKKITQKDVPAAVTGAFQKAYPTATVRGYAKEVEGGKTYYEIESMNGKMSLDVLYIADGTLAEVEEGLVPADLPAPVKDAVNAKHPDAKITRAEKTTRGDVVTYELGLASGKSRMSMVVDPSGKVVKESKPEGKKPKREEKEKKED